MPIINRIANFAEEMKQWRQELHSNPELKFDCYETAEFIVKRLKEFGISEIHTGIAKTGIVAIINGKKEGETIGLRADMDALPLQEIKQHSYKSKKVGIMLLSQSHRYILVQRITLYLTRHLSMVPLERLIKLPKNLCMKDLSLFVPALKSHLIAKLI